MPVIAALSNNNLEYCKAVVAAEDPARVLVCLLALSENVERLRAALAEAGIDEPDLLWVPWEPHPLEPGLH